MEGESSSFPSSSISFQVKFAGRTIPLSVSPNSSVKELKTLLQPLTNVLPRGQKLICKGKVLADSATLKSSEIGDGSRVMLVASHGVHQGDGPITNNTSENLRKSANAARNSQNSAAAPLPVEKSRSERWVVTGVVALSECQLKAIPEELWVCGPKARLLDLSNNFIEEIPEKISSLSSVTKLLLNGNNLSDKTVSWGGLSSLKHLTTLNLSHNQLTSLPSILCTMTSLIQLDVTSNRLTVLPDEIGALKELQVLKAGNNRIGSVPPNIGNCSSLVEIDLSSNLLSFIPDSLGSLTRLKCLYLRNNGLHSLPSTLFKMCLQLSTLDLHGTQITNDVLRQLEGWEAFDDRRRQKLQKQLDFHVGSSDKFEEGADQNNG